MSLQEDIYDRLKKSIIYGELSPGEKLSEVALAGKMKVSRTPIREAFRQLQMEGYITVESNKGAYVSKLPPEEIEEIYDIISLLEGYAAELTARRVKDSELRELRELQEQLVVSASQKKYREYIEKNTEFHHLIACLSGSKKLVKIINELRTRIYRYRLVSVTIPGYLEEYASHHEDVIDAIGKKDFLFARKYMQEHVIFVKEVLVNFLNENPGL